MKQACILVLAVFAFTLSVFGQNGVPTIKAEVVSAFVWGEDSPSGAVSSTIRDPPTGNTIHMLSYAGIEVSSRIGFEGVGADKVGTLLNSTTTIVNSTGSTLSVRYGGISVDGHAASPLSLRPSARSLRRRDAKAIQAWWNLGKYTV